MQDGGKLDWGPLERAYLQQLKSHRWLSCREVSTQTQNRQKYHRRLSSLLTKEGTGRLRGKGKWPSWWFWSSRSRAQEWKTASWVQQRFDTADWINLGCLSVSQPCNRTSCFKFARRVNGHDTSCLCLQKPPEVDRLFDWSMKTFNIKCYPSMLDFSDWCLIGLRVLNSSRLTFKSNLGYRVYDTGNWSITSWSTFWIEL